MKKLFFSFLTTVAFIAMAATNVNAQQALKIGFFDPNVIVQNLPEFKSVVQDKLDQYDRDSLGVAHDYLQQQYLTLDSTWRADSAKKVPKAILDVTAQKRQETYLQIAQWGQIAQQYHQQKLQQLAAPLFTKVMASYKKMKEAKKVTLVLVQDALFPDGEQGPYENLTIDVAKDLGIPTGDNGGGAAPSAAPAPAKPAAGGRR
jgi:Skp family chaperone for outer membrane proteins